MYQAFKLQQPPLQIASLDLSSLLQVPALNNRKLYVMPFFIHRKQKKTLDFAYLGFEEKSFGCVTILIHSLY